MAVGFTYTKNSGTVATAARARHGNGGRPRDGHDLGSGTGTKGTTTRTEGCFSGGQGSDRRRTWPWRAGLAAGGGEAGGWVREGRRGGVAWRADALEETAEEGRSRPMAAGRTMRLGRARGGAGLGVRSQGRAGGGRPPRGRGRGAATGWNRCRRADVQEATTTGGAGPAEDLRREEEEGMGTCGVRRRNTEVAGSGRARSSRRRAGAWLGTRLATGKEPRSE